MIAWMDLTVFFVWVFFIVILFNISSLLNLLIISELVWVSFFVYSAFLSSYYDELLIFLVGLYLLAIATSETTIGLSLLILKLIIFGSIGNADNFNFKNYYLCRKKKVNLVNSKKNV